VNSRRWEPEKSGRSRNKPTHKTLPLAHLCSDGFCCVETTGRGDEVNIIKSTLMQCEGPKKKETRRKPVIQYSVMIRTGSPTRTENIKKRTEDQYRARAFTRKIVTLERHAARVCLAGRGIKAPAIQCMSAFLEKCWKMVRRSTTNSRRRKWN